MAERDAQAKVTLALDNEDVMRVIGSILPKGDRAKFFEFPSAVYSMHPFDKVNVDGKVIGVSTWIGYSSNEGKMLTLAMIDADVRRVRQRSDAGVGRAQRRHHQADRRAARADRDQGDRLPVPYSKPRERPMRRRLAGRL